MSSPSGFGISRRAMLGTMAGAAAAIPALARAQQDASASAPNILWLVSEDNFPFIGAYGDRLAHTPTIDRLAAEGLLYRNAYANAPVCAPSRFGILTGMYPESCSPAQNMRANAKLPQGYRTYPEILRAAGYFCTNNEKTDYNCDVDPTRIWDRQGSNAHWRDRPAGKPFMAVFNYMTSHESQNFQAMSGRVTPDMIQVPPHLPDTPAIRQDYASYYNRMEVLDGQLAQRLAELEADGLAEDTIVFYYSDNGGVLPRSKRYCYDEGLRCGLVVRVPAKWRHWMPAGPGSKIAAPVTFIDLVPTLLSLAGVAQPAGMPGKAFLGPAIAGPQPYAFGMRNRMDERIDFVRTVTDGRWRYIRNYMPHRPTGQHGAFEWLSKAYQSLEREYIEGRLDENQSRFFMRKPFEELYDLQTDPAQVNNLAGDPAHRGRLKTLSRALDAHMLAIHDNGFLAEGMRGEGYVASRVPSLYPLPQLLRLGAIAARGRPGSLGRLRAALASPIDVVRYWGATGMLILGEKAAPARDVLRTAMERDASEHVRVVAAEALANLGDEEAAVPVLIGLLRNGSDWPVQLHAINALTFLGQRAMPALDAARTAAQSEQEYLRNAGKYLALRLSGEYTPETPIFDLQRLTGRSAGPAPRP